MNVLFGPLCGVAGYAFATAAVIAPFLWFQHCHWVFCYSKAGKIANMMNYLAFFCLVISKHAGFSSLNMCVAFMIWVVVLIFPIRGRFQVPKERSWYVCSFQLILVCPAIVQVIHAVVAPFTLGEKLTSRRSGFFVG